MTNEPRQRIVSRLNGQNQVDAVEAAKAAWENSDERLERPLILTLKKGRRPFDRVAAAFAMQMVTTPKTMRALESASRTNPSVPVSEGKQQRHSHTAIGKSHMMCC